LASGEILGRDDLVASLRRDLEVQSVGLTAERRMGKTSILTLLQELADDRTVVVYRDLEGIDSPSRFIENTLNDVLPHIGAGKRVREWLRDKYKVIGGMELRDITLPELGPRDWRRLLVEVFGMLGDDGKDFVLLCDELPLMVEKIRTRHGPTEAIDLLDLLREVRKAQPNVRMVLTGSIGLHHVLAKLRAEGNTNDPINDVLMVTVEPLAEADAVMLAKRLFFGESLIVPEPDAAAAALVASVDRIPFYIHHVVRGLRARASEPVTVERVDAVVDAAFTDPQDPWKLRYYDERIDSDFGARAPQVRTILDTISISQPAAFAALVNAVASRHQPASTEQEVHELLSLLAADHYVTLDRNGHWSFAYEIVGRAWRVRRSLG